jgi:hypothetical protein
MSDGIVWTNDRRRLSQLIPWPRNPRRIRDREAQRLQESLAEFGQPEVIAIGPGNEVYNGHQRLKAWAQTHGDIEVDVRVASRALTEREREKLTVYLHKGAAGEWDFDLLVHEFNVDDLMEWGFDAVELEIDGADKGAGRDTEPALDRAEELRQKWGVEPGQLWALGEHRLICGDCTDASTVERVMGGERARSLVFDPEWDAMSDAITGYDSVLAFCDGASLGRVTQRYGDPTWLFVWDCVSSWYTPNRPLRRAKLCAWYGNIERYNFDGWHYGDSGESRTVWNTRGEYQFTPDPRGKHLSDVFSFPITQLHADKDHNHSKPVDWVSLLIGNCTGGDVLDPFLGSGTTLIACENLGRRCRAVEIAPGYVAVALERWATHTGRTPELVTGNA